MFKITLETLIYQFSSLTAKMAGIQGILFRPITAKPKYMQPIDIRS